MANTVTTSASDFVNMMKTYKPKQAKQSEWEQYFLQPLQQQTQADVSTIRAQTGYDISSAFANYKKAERQILQSSQLGSGFKQELISDLDESYGQQYTTEKIEEAGQLADIQTNYYKQLDLENKRLGDIASKLSKIDVATQDYLINTKGYDLNKIYKTDSSSGMQSLTDYGSAAFRKVMYDDPEYLEYLKEENLYEDYATYRTDLNKYMAGIDENTVDYDIALDDIFEKQKVLDKYSGDFGELKLSEDATAKDYKLAYQQEIAKNVQMAGRNTVKYKANTIYSKGKSYPIEYIAIQGLSNKQHLPKELSEFLRTGQGGEFFTYNNEVYLKLNDRELVKLKE